MSRRAESQPLRIRNYMRDTHSFTHLGAYGFTRYIWPPQASRKQSLAFA